MFRSDESNSIVNEMRGRVVLAGALLALVRSGAELAGPALDRFHEMFRGEGLVIDTWFSIQASAPERDGRVFERARTSLCARRTACAA